jgi:microcompartment protein CcmL/EutN
MVEADILAADTARQAMVDLAACRVIRGRATVVAVRGPLATVEVAVRPAAEATTGAEVAVVTRAEVEVTPAAEAEVIQAVVDMAADTTRLQSAS